MKINPVSNCNIAFGYSKKSQQYLDEKIENMPNKALADTIEKTSAMCNSIEQVVKTNEKRRITINSMALEDFFVTLKNALLELVCDVFDDSKDYINYEYDYYSNSLSKCDDQILNWRSEIVEGLGYNEYTKILNSPPEESCKEEGEDEDEDEDLFASESIAGFFDDTQKNTQSSSIKPSPYVQKLVPTKFSPAGFSDIMGMEKIKTELMENIVQPYLHPDQAELDFTEYGKQTPAGVLLYGPPGCGKTYIIQALAAEIGTDVFMMNSAVTGSKYINQTSNNIKKAFDYVGKLGANSEKPVFIFLDEMDAMTQNRTSDCSDEDNKATATLLKCIEDAKANNVIVVGATNRYDLIDPAIKRRFDIKRFVGLPDEQQTLQQLKNALSKRKKGEALLKDEKALLEISKLLKGYSYHSINTISAEASQSALLRNRDDIKLIDYKKAIEQTNEEKLNEQKYKAKTGSKVAVAGFKN